MGQTVLGLQILHSVGQLLGWLLLLLLLLGLIVLRVV